jgi:tripartite-type tricarboxylate transporter receptor subunit TctC
MGKKQFLILFFWMLASCNSLNGFSQELPKQIRLVVPFTAGGNVDLSARIVASSLQTSLRRIVIVDNKPGANASIGADFVSKSAPDGSTILLGTAETLAINPQLNEKSNYDAMRDFTAVGIVGDFCFALVVSPSLRVRDVKDFVQLSKQRSSTFNFSSWGQGSTSQIAFELFQNVSGTDLLHVPFSGAVPAMSAVASGEVQAMMVPLSVALPQAQSGRLQILGISSKDRSPLAPDIPTLSEQGYPVAISGWHVLVVPKATPKNVVHALNLSLNLSLSQQSVSESLRKIGITPRTQSPDDSQKFIEAEYKKWGGVLDKSTLSKSH